MPRKEDKEMDLEQIKSQCESQINRFLQPENFQRLDTAHDPVHASRVLQLELDLLRTMQKLVVQLKLLNSIPKQICAGNTDKFKYFIHKLSQLQQQKRQEDKMQDVPACSPEAPSRQEAPMFEVPNQDYLSSQQQQLMPKQYYTQQEIYRDKPMPPMPYEQHL